MTKPRRPMRVLNPDGSITTFTIQPLTKAEAQQAFAPTAADNGEAAGQHQPPTADAV